MTTQINRMAAMFGSTKDGSLIADALKSKRERDEIEQRLEKVEARLERLERIEGISHELNQADVRDNRPGDRDSRNLH